MGKLSRFYIGLLSLGLGCLGLGLGVRFKLVLWSVRVRDGVKVLRKCCTIQSFVSNTG